jgi:hypothetical protein
LKKSYGNLINNIVSQKPKDKYFNNILLYF